MSLTADNIVRIEVPLHLNIITIVANMIITIPPRACCKINSNKVSKIYNPTLPTWLEIMAIKAKGRK